MNLNNRRTLLMVAAATAVICLVVLFFFRTEIFLSAGGRIVSILEPFIYGIVIAWLLHPLSKRFEQLLARILDHAGTGRLKGLIRLVSVLLSLAVLFAALFLLLMLVLPELITSISRLIRQMPGAVRRFEVWTNSLELNGHLSEELIVAVQGIIDTMTERLQTFLKTDLLPWLQSYAVGMLSSFRGVLDVIMNFGLGCIIAIYLMTDWERFGAQVKLAACALLPQKVTDWLFREASFTNEKFSGFIIGKIVDSLIIGILCFLFVSITNMPYGMLVSVIVGVTNLIPFFGPYLGAIPSIILLLTVSPGKCLVFAIFIIILQQLDGNVIGPMILGDRLGLSGFWILFAILVCGSLWGIVGMLIGAPVFAVVYDLIRTFIRSKLQKNGNQLMLADYDRQYPKEPPAKKNKRSAKKIRQKQENRTKEEI